jgi:prevent-host-death family protein
MVNVSARILQDQLSSYLERVESGEEIFVLRDGKPVAALVPMSRFPEMSQGERLVALAARGLVALPKRTSGSAFQGPALPNRGRLASKMISEDRR